MFELGALRLVSIISPSSDFGIMYHFFSWTPYSSRNILSKFKKISQPDRLFGIRFNRFIESTCMKHWFGWFWSPIPTWLGPISSRLVLGCILGPFWPYFGFLPAHHESIWILGGEASWKLKIVSLHGEWGGELMGKLISRLTGALSRAWRREKWRGFDGWKSGTIKEGKNHIWKDFFFFLSL